MTKTLIFVAPPLEPVVMTYEDAMRCAEMHLAPLEAYLDHYEWSFGERPIIQDQPSDADPETDGL